MPESTPEDRQPVSISSELFDFLRGFCDQKGIRFVDFIEDALENAAHRHDLEGLLNDAAQLEATLKIKQQKAFRQGFQQGVLVATASFQGNLEVSRRMIPREIKNQPRPQAVAGGQLKLFK